MAQRNKVLVKTTHLFLCLLSLGCTDNGHLLPVSSLHFWTTANIQIAVRWDLLYMLYVFFLEYRVP